MATSATSLGTDEFTIQGPVISGTQLYLNEELADFHFICKSSDGQDERIPAHKLLLISMCDAFRAMFNESWIEKDEVTIVDASAGAFREFLQFFYLGTVKLTMENIAEVMNLGNKYGIAECYDCCAKYLEIHLSNDDVCWGYELAVHLDHQGLENFCDKLIRLKTKSVFKSESFLKLKQKTVKRILQMGSLNCSETDVFLAVSKWIKTATVETVQTDENVRGRFSDLLHEIRFGLMTIEEFGAIDPGNIFTQDEYHEIKKMMKTKKYQPKIFKENRKVRPKSIEFDESEQIECNRNLSSDNSYFVKNFEFTTFKTNRPMLLRAFDCVSLEPYKEDWDDNYWDDWDDWDGEVQITFNIYEIRGENNKKLIYKGSKEREIMYESCIELKDPIFIRPGLTYEIRMNVAYDMMSSGISTREILESEIHIEPDVTIQFAKGKTPGKGLIRSLRLCKI